MERCCYRSEHRFEESELVDYFLSSYRFFSYSSVQLVEDDEKKRFEWPSNDSTMHPISPFRLRLYQQVIRRVVLWLVKYIDIQIDSLTVVVRDEQVGLSVGYHRIAQ